ncbi:MAG: HEAT repeat domain-containing protein [Phycisphaeraceae bacterium]|nr:HEAT repeat domain-containing protein [Phycisphaeraceae bacterium]
MVIDAGRSSILYGPADIFNEVSEGPIETQARLPANSPTGEAEFDLLQAVESLPDPVVDIALAEALRAGEPGDLGRLADVLTRRAPSAAQGALVEVYHHLDRPMRTAIAGMSGHLARGIREAAASSQPRTLANLVELIRHSHDLSLLYLLVDLFRRGDAQVTDAAAGLLEGIAAQLANRSELPWVPARQAQRVQLVLEACAQSATQQGSGCSAVARSLLWLTPLSIGILSGLPRQRNVLMAKAIDAILSDPDEPCNLRALPGMLGLEQHRAAALRGLARLTRRNAPGAIVHQSHYTLRPAVGAAFGHLTEPDKLVPPDWPASASVDSVRWVAALPLDEATGQKLLLDVCNCEDRQARARALASQIDGAPTGDDALDASRFLPWTDDPHPAIAMTACRFLKRRRWSGWNVHCRRLLQSQHRSVRRLASLELGQEAFDRLWHGWNQLTAQQRSATAVVLLKLGMDVFWPLSVRLRFQDDAARLRAITIIELLDMGQAFETQLLGRLGDDSAAVVASAVKALGQATSHRALVACEMAMDHPDARVRANAIEALDRMKSRRHAQRLLRMARDESNRARANAIGALLRIEPGPAMASLARMLADPRSAYRRSALWLVESMQLQKLSSLIHELAGSDPEPTIRHRAGRIAAAFQKGATSAGGEPGEPQNAA